MQEKQKPEETPPQKMDDVLKRMLGTKPQPKVPNQPEGKSKKA